MIILGTSGFTTTRMVTTVVMLCITVATNAQTRYVDNNNCPGPGTGTEGDPYCVIQDCIDAAGHGDECIVADGTYTGDGNRDLNRKIGRKDNRR